MQSSMLCVQSESKYAKKSLQQHGSTAVQPSADASLQSTEHRRPTEPVFLYDLVSLLSESICQRTVTALLISMAPVNMLMQTAQTV